MSVGARPAVRYVLITLLGHGAPPAFAAALMLLGPACSSDAGKDAGKQGGAAGAAVAGGTSVGGSAGSGVINSDAGRGGVSSAGGLGGASGAGGNGASSSAAGDGGSLSGGQSPDGGSGGSSGGTPNEPSVDPTAPLTAIAFFPSKERTDTCADASVSIQFNRPPIIKAGGKIQIVDASGVVFDSVTSNPKNDLYFADLVTRTAGGKSFQSEVLDVVFNSVVFHPQGRLKYGQTYYVTVDEGMITDSIGSAFSVKKSDNWTFTVRGQAPPAASTYTLASDGSGDYCSLESLLAELPSTASTPRVVTVKRGIYPGIVRISASNLHFVGAGMDQSIFSHKNSATMNTSREGIIVSGSDVTFENLTVFNTYLKDGSGQQAEALYVAEGSRRVFLKNVHLRSHQDTLRVDGSAYMQGGKISGSTDPLWGYGAFYCDGCELSSRTSGHAFVVARSTEGFGLVNCRVTKDEASVNNTYLAQYHDGSEPGKIAFVNCKIDSHVVGWKRPENNAWYEYNNVKLQTGAPVTFAGKQLTAGSAELAALGSPQAWLGWSP